MATEGFGLCTAESFGECNEGEVELNVRIAVGVDCPVDAALDAWTAGENRMVHVYVGNRWKAATIKSR